MSSKLLVGLYFLMNKDLEVFWRGIKDSVSPTFLSQHLCPLTIPDFDLVKGQICNGIFAVYMGVHKGVWN